MRTNKRQTNLKDIKASFQQSGYVDWHFNPRLSDSQNEDHDGEVVVQTA
ncbi:ATP-dependent Clp protease adapter ClpS, partial [Acinetobacter baumannii]|nr:ATP-dependent Clp protease adapter ClpS [Acinetobacter baumannii]